MANVEEYLAEERTQALAKAQELDRIWEGRKIPNAKSNSDWPADCDKWRGQLLTGRYSHWCYDWDGLPMDETCIEFNSCECYDSIRKV